MKMISQLTRQAMSRHRLLSVNAVPTTALPIPAAQPVPPPLPPQNTAPILREPPPSIPSIREPIQPPPAPQPRPRTIYQQLMKSHDRMTERHI